MLRRECNNSVKGKLAESNTRFYVLRAKNKKIGAFQRVVGLEQNEFVLEVRHK